MDPEEFRRIGHQIIDWVADYRAHVADYPVRSTLTPGAVRAQLPSAPPAQPAPAVQPTPPAAHERPLPADWVLDVQKLVQGRLVTYEEAVKHSSSPSDFALLFRGEVIACQPPAEFKEQLRWFARDVMPAFEGAKIAAE